MSSSFLTSAAVGLFVTAAASNFFRFPFPHALVSPVFLSLLISFGPCAAWCTACKRLLRLPSVSFIHPENVGCYPGSLHPLVPRHVYVVFQASMGGASLRRAVRASLYWTLDSLLA